MTNDNGVWSTLSSEKKHTNPWFSVRHDKVKKPNGESGDYYVVDTKSAAVFIVAINDKNQILLINQYRYATQQFSWEIPGGSAEDDELLTAAQRELKEEAGLKAKKWQQVGQAESMNGIASEIMHIFSAKDLVEAGMDAKEAEGIGKNMFVAADDLISMIEKGEITDSQTITSITQVFLASGRMGFKKFK